MVRLVIARKGAIMRIIALTFVVSALISTLLFLSSIPQEKSRDFYCVVALLGLAHLAPGVNLPVCFGPTSSLRGADGGVDSAYRLVPVSVNQGTSRRSFRLKFPGSSV